METSMRKTALTIFSALLISGLAVQTVAASERHTQFRRAYNQMTNGSPDAAAAPTVRYIWDNGLGLGASDPSRVGGQDPTFRPSGS
jgi:hypothetical protein